ncbi:hypothetical protein PINS_up009740 [Pythium insidiosum]|nr:hypothetical protein PINS_up009740 [Pythium insidiosum]
MVLLGLCVGAIEDACVCMCFTPSLWLLDAALLTRGPSRIAPERWRAWTPTWRTIVYALHFAAGNALLGIDLVFVRTRQMRFRWDFVTLFLRERHTNAAAQLEIDDAEWSIAAQHASLTCLFAALLAWRVHELEWLHLAEWDRDIWRAAAIARRWSAAHCSHFLPRLGRTVVDNTDDDEAKPRGPPRLARWSHRLLLVGAATALAVTTTIVVTKCVPSLVAVLAWNASLAEPVRLVFGIECMHRRAIKLRRPLRTAIDATSELTRFADSESESLVRHTLGFQGPQAFNVNVNAGERPNVLVISVESFRKRDSRYLLQDDVASLERWLPHNVTLTPHFDAWAKRGIAFSNMWSSWRTSRSLEQILFGQLPYDSPTDSGTTGGRTDTSLSGLPQLFRAKGYETFFTTGTRTDYDGWERFLQSHGFDSVLDGWDLAEIGANEMSIDWTIGDRVMAYWGVHDDLTFDVLSHMLRKRSRAKPWFAVHYTISSHVPFDERPDWFFRFRETKDFPDFSPLYASIEDPERRELVRNYAEMRYFADLAFGRFMAELDVSGVLKNTIVVVVGDHGQAPELGAAMPEQDQVSCMNVAAAIIAEGRLGQDAGKVIRGATAHYDWLNTIADIVGVPEGGFLQTGIGRSLKRTSGSTESRLVYSHNPALNLAAVQGSVRIEFLPDVPDMVRVFNIARDPERRHDVSAQIPRRRLQEITDMCDEARALMTYFTQRWDHKCLLDPRPCPRS